MNLTKTKWQLVSLGEVCFPKPSNAKIIKGTLQTVNNGSLFPAYSATGQDVFSDGYDFEEDGIVISAVGARCGKCFLATGKWRAIANTHVIFPNKEKVGVKFLWYLLNDESFWIKGGTAQPFVKVKDSLKKKIPLPSLEEQEHIVFLLDQANALSRQRRDALRLLDGYVQSIFVDMFGDPMKNEKKWSTKKLSEIADVRSGVTKGRKFGDKKTIMMPYMRVANVQDGHIDLSEVKEIEVLPSDAEKYVLRIGDVLLTEGGDPDKLGRGAVWHGEIENCIHQNHIFRVRTVSSEIRPMYLSALIGTEYGKRYFLKAAKQTTGIATINITQLGNFPVLVPNVDLQIRYEEIISDIEIIEKNMERQGAEIENYFAAFLQKAFAGAL